MITVLALGSRGDVQPFVALAVALREAGERVRLVTNENFAALAAEHGAAPGGPLEFYSLGASVQELLQTQAGQRMVQGGNFLHAVRYYFQEVQKWSWKVQQESWQACQGSRVLVFSIIAPWGADLAEALGIPSIPCLLVPGLPTGEFPFPQGDLPGLGRLLNRLTHRAGLGLIWQMFRPAINRFRTQELGLPPARQGIMRLLRGSPILCAFSPAIVPPPTDWPANAVVTGSWFLPAPSGWQPPAALSAFLEAGPPPVYIGFGSMADRQAEATTRLVIEAVQLAGVRAVLASGWGGLQASHVPETIHMLEQAPHDWLFPRMAGVVHHGGAGTTAAGLRAGVPCLAVPHFGDQYFWGRRIAALGAGPLPLARRKLTAPALAERLRQLVETPAYASRAATLGQAIHLEDGLGTAIRIIQNAL